VQNFPRLAREIKVLHGPQWKTQKIAEIEMYVLSSVSARL
jgi:hypothetical protein